MVLRLVLCCVNPIPKRWFCSQDSSQPTGDRPQLMQRKWKLRYVTLRYVMLSPSKSFWLPPANKVCEGYVFTGVCLSGGGGLSPEGLCRGGESLSGRQRPPPYASYWNAFWFSIRSILLAQTCVFVLTSGQPLVLCLQFTNLGLEGAVSSRVCDSQL